MQITSNSQVLTANSATTPGQSFSVGSPVAHLPCSNIIGEAALNTPLTKEIQIPSQGHRHDMYDLLLYSESFAHRETGLKNSTGIDEYKQEAGTKPESPPTQTVAVGTSISWRRVQTRRAGDASRPCTTLPTSSCRVEFIFKPPVTTRWPGSHTVGGYVLIRAAQALQLDYKQMPQRRHV